MKAEKRDGGATRMPFKTSTEFDLIAWIRQHAQSFPPSIVRQIGDDCAVFDASSTCTWVVTTDMLVEEVHFRRRWISPYFLGRKSLLVNLSDLAAMGAQPYACLLGLALPRDLPEEYVHSLISGFLEESRRWKTPLVGGDISRSGAIHLNVTVWGYVNSGAPVYRSKAISGDRVVLIGETGFARLGLEVLYKEDPQELWQVASEKALAAWAGEEFRYRCLKAHFLPDPLIEVGTWLQENSLANAMIDVSDGLAADLLHIARESRLTAHLEVSQLILPNSCEDSEISLSSALDGGEDYALLFASSDEQWQRLQAYYPSHFPAYRVIGKLREGKPRLDLIQQDRKVGYEPQGFDHFR